MNIGIANYNNNPNIGLFCWANDHFCLAGSDAPAKLVKKIQEVLEVPVYRITLCGTSLIGIFCTGNNNGIILPELVFDSELRHLHKLGLKTAVIESELTAVGNNILINNTGAVLHPEYSERVMEEIAGKLNINIKKGSIAGLDTVGSLAAPVTDKCIISHDAAHPETALIEKTLNVRCHCATVLFGTPYIRSAIVSNSKGILVSDGCTGPEIAEIDEILR